MAGLGAAFGGLLGNAYLEQIVLYGFVNQILSGAIAPFILSAQQFAFSADPVVPLSPQELAEALLRNAPYHGGQPITGPQAAAEAQLSGVNAERMSVLAYLAGNAPAPEAMAEALRRGFVDQNRYLTGIRQGRLRDEWAPLMQQLSLADPTPATALLSYLKGFSAYADAKGLFQTFGGNPDYFDLSFNVEGEGPSPLEAASAVHRNLIPENGIGANVTSFEQAVHESAFRNKWKDVFWLLSQYLPPPRTIVAMLKEGAFTQQQASDLLAQHGLPADEIAAYLKAASMQKTSATKQLAQSTVEALYIDRIISQQQAITYLTDLAYTTQEAQYIIAVVDAKITQHYLTSAVGKVHTQYVGWHIDAPTATKALTQLQLPATNITDLLTEWGIERTANAPSLTPSQWAKAFKDNIIDQTAATAALERLGYSVGDAWLFLSQYIGAAQPNRPAGV